MVHGCSEEVIPSPHLVSAIRQITGQGSYFSPNFAFYRASIYLSLPFPRFFNAGGRTGHRWNFGPWPPAGLDPVRNPFIMGAKKYMPLQLETVGYARVVGRYDADSGLNVIKFIISIVVIGLSADLVSRSRDGMLRYAAGYNLGLVSTQAKVLGGSLKMTPRFPPYD